MSGLCKDCSWWSSAGYYEEIEQPAWYGACDLVSNAWFIPDETMAALRPHQYGSVLTTHANFGCNQFEAKT